MISSMSDGRPNFVIATPTKCGTTTLEELTRRHGGGRVSRGGVERESFRIVRDTTPRRQHRMTVPAGFEDADRVLLVRNPFTRYPSMYEYLKAPQNYSKWGAREVAGREWRGLDKGRSSAYAGDSPMTFSEFLYFIAYSREAYAHRRWVKRRGTATDTRAYRSPWVWLDRLDEDRRLLEAQPGEGQGVTLLRLENLWGGLKVLRERYGLDELLLRESIHANKTLTYGGRSAANYWAIGCRAKKVKAKGWDVEDLRGKQGCECPVCAIGVVAEASSVGYSRVLG